MDWLYELVFDQIRDVWKEAHRFAEQTSKPNQPPQLPPDSVLVLAMSEGKDGWCRGEILREWIFTGTDFVLQRPALERTKRPAVNRGALFERGLVAFHIAPNRRRVVFMFQLGRLYGRGETFLVTGQGITGRLTRDPEAYSWVS